MLWLLEGVMSEVKTHCYAARMQRSAESPPKKMQSERVRTHLYYGYYISIHVPVVGFQDTWLCDRTAVLYAAILREISAVSSPFLPFYFRSYSFFQCIPLAVPASPQFSLFPLSAIVTHYYYMKNKDG